jgi:hypothetical protein
MTSQVGLVPLRCIRCDTPVPAEADQVAWVCNQCTQGLLLDEAEGLLPLEIHYAAGIAPDKLGKPFWVARGRVTLQREAHQGWSNKDQKTAYSFWEDPRTFVIPAFTVSLEQLLELSLEKFDVIPKDSQGQVVPFEPVTLSPMDLPALVEFLVLAREAGRKDKVRKIDISVELNSPVLWILP